jgi:ABC-type uncharacterized transport system substrate-binding protein
MTETAAWLFDPSLESTGLALNRARPVNQSAFPHSPCGEVTEPNRSDAYNRPCCVHKNKGADLAGRRGFLIAGSAVPLSTRRSLLIAFSTATLCPRILLAQSKQAPARARRIGLLSTFSLAEAVPFHQAFREGLRELGWVEGTNITIVYRHADGVAERLPALAAEFARLNVDVIFAGGTISALAAKEATSTIPVVMVSSNPLGSRLVASLAKPGSNITGLSIMTQEVAAKRLELLREIVPKVHRVAFLWNALSSSLLAEAQSSAHTLGFQLLSVEVRSTEDLDRVFALLSKERPEGLFTFTSAVLTTNRKRIVEFAARNRLPAIYHVEDFVEDGGLMSYAPSLRNVYRHAATYVDKILKGAKPADLPVEQPTKLELVLNMKTARELGITVPQSVLVRADRVIE